jgi:hypothetical protein
LEPFCHNDPEDLSDAMGLSVDGMPNATMNWALQRLDFHTGSMIPEWSTIATGSMSGSVDSGGFHVAQLSVGPAGDSARVNFSPTPGKLTVGYTTPGRIQQFTKNSQAEAFTYLDDTQPLKAVVNQVTHKIDVTQNVAAKTYLPETDRKAGMEAPHWKQELKRVELYRDYMGYAGVAAAQLAAKGFKDVESARQAVQASTAEFVKAATIEGKRRFDLFNSNN